MSTTQVLRQSLPVTTRSRPRPAWILRGLARAHALRLDRELAAGIPTWHSPLHAARAVQLTTHRRRRSLADSLERLAERTERSGPPGLGAAIPPSREQVRESLPLILALSLRLRTPEPVDARGMAGLRALLNSPIYIHSRPGALLAALQAVSEWLDVAN